VCESIPENKLLADIRVSYEFTIEMWSGKLRLQPPSTDRKNEWALQKSGASNVAKSERGPISA
jgi:hypothetical protein